MSIFINDDSTLLINRRNQMDGLRLLGQIKDNSIKKTEICPEDFIKELLKEVGDCAWFLSGICAVEGVDFEDVLKANLDKLSDRQRRGVIDGNGDNR